MVDILMSTYNGEEFVEEQIESIMNQTYNNIRLIIRDDGSKDKTIDIIKKMQQKYNGNSEKIKLFCEENIGAKNSFLKLLDYSDSEYIMFSDQDDVWYPEKIDKLIKLHKEDNTLVFCNMYVVNSKLVKIDDFFNYQGFNKTKTKFEDLLKRNIIPGCTMLFDKKIKDKIKWKNAFNITMHDSYIALVASAFGNIVVTDEPLQMYRQHDKNVVGANKKITFASFVQRIKEYTFEDIKNYIEYLKESRKKSQANEFFDVYYEELDQNKRMILSKLTRKK